MTAAAAAVVVGCRGRFSFYTLKIRGSGRERGAGGSKAGRGKRHRGEGRLKETAAAAAAADRFTDPSLWRPTMRAPSSAAAERPKNMFGVRACTRRPARRRGTALAA